MALFDGTGYDPSKYLQAATIGALPTSQGSPQATPQQVAQLPRVASSPIQGGATGTSSTPGGTPPPPPGPAPFAPTFGGAPQQPSSISFSQLDPGYAGVTYGQDTGSSAGRQDWQHAVAEADSALQNAAQRGMNVTDIPKGLQGDWTGLQQTGQLGMNPNGTVPVLHNADQPQGQRAPNADESSEFNAFQSFVNSPQGQAATAEAGGNPYIAWERMQSINAGVAPNTGYGSGTTAGSSPLGRGPNGDFYNNVRGGAQTFDQYGAPTGFSSDGTPQNTSYNPFAKYGGVQPSEPVADWAAIAAGNGVGGRGGPIFHGGASPPPPPPADPNLGPGYHARFGNTQLLNPSQQFLGLNPGLYPVGDGGGFRTRVFDAQD